MKHRLLLPFLSALLLLTACGGGTGTDQGKSDTPTKMPEFTPVNHSYSRPDDAVVTHLKLDAEVDFKQKEISATATYDIDNRSGANHIILDIKDITVFKVMVDGSTEAVSFVEGKRDSVLGRGLAIPVTKETKSVSIQYKTSPEAGALQWLNPLQTAGQNAPFLYTQSQAILARTWVPCQDVPGVRFTYEANVKVPKDLMAVMSASNPQQKNEEGVYSFEMKQPIPSYLMALAVGDLAFAPVGEQTGVYAEPSVLESAVYEFGEMDKMLHAAEELYGTYVWDRYDVIVLPPSFPFGGMENPRLTFATPTILAGDRSLTALVAHELAHSWSGNLVTNVNWDDFWLNEGFTVYFERRIMEAVYGQDFANMLAILGHQDLQHSVESLEPHDTHLKLKLEGRDPDDGMTDIAYEKGYFFLRLLEETVGRESFDAFLKSYFTSNAFKSMDTERFVTLLEKELLNTDELKETVRLKEWIYGPGIPDNCPELASQRFDKVGQVLESWKGGTAPASLGISDWTSNEWQQFLRQLPKSMTLDQMTALDRAFGFTTSGNSEIAALWFVHSIHNRYERAYPIIENFLAEVGRRKFLTPIYSAMKDSDQLDWAKKVYLQSRVNYHSVSTNTLDELLGIDATALAD